jgi:tRNA pseudouridine55 synthase
VTEDDDGRISGFAIVDKPVGITSYRLIASLGSRLGDQTKSGHAGTLDSFASGVLVCLFGRYTRLSDYFMGAGKGYDADVLFGEETDTLDPSGRVIATGTIPSREDIERVLPGFRGDIMQAPPAYSAVHIQGERAYERALKGQDVRPEPRPVTISSLDLLSYSSGTARIRVACSKGTYIRSLARDLALAVGSRGRLAALRRTFSGPYSVESATSAEGFNKECLRKLTVNDAASLGITVLRIDGASSRAFRNGLPLFRMDAFSSVDSTTPVAVFDPDEAFLGIIAKAGTNWRYAFVLGGSY